jgi:shikimate kinase
MKPGHLVLIGYRGTGKSTVGRRLATALGLPIADADLEIVRRASKSIRAIFDEQGEDAFRDLESSVLADLLAAGRSVIATGGGVVLRPSNRTRLETAGTIVWLRAKPESILARLAADRQTGENRPPLTDKAAAAEVVELLKIRAPLYQSLAHEIVDTDEKTPEAIAREILGRLGVSGSMPNPPDLGESA